MQARWLTALLGLQITLWAPAKYTQMQAGQILDNNGIGWDSSIQPRCTPRSNPKCISLDGINMVTIDGVVKLHRDSNCPIVVRSGTEVGHSGCKTPADRNCSNASNKSHWNGYKVDLRQKLPADECLSTYIRSHFGAHHSGRDCPGQPYKGCCVEQYKSPGSDIYCSEYKLNHWDVLYVA